MKQYLSTNIHVSNNVHWLNDLKRRVEERGIGVKWQNKYHHITLAFIYDIPEEVNVFPPLYKCLAYRAAPSLTFDKLDVFTTASGNHVINMTSSNPSEEFCNLLREVREAVDGLGCDYNHDFRLHVTLGKVSEEQISLDDMKAIIDEVSMPSFTYTFEKVEYLRYDNHEKIDEWIFFPDKEAAEAAREERMRRAFRNALSNIQLFTDPDF